MKKPTKSWVGVISFYNLEITGTLKACPRTFQELSYLFDLYDKNFSYCEYSFGLSNDVIFGYLCLDGMVIVTLNLDLSSSEFQVKNGFSHFEVSAIFFYEKV